ncbi:MAG: bifunctional glutamate N-acetyltransferase/amino-acid acetyltransferase ArgJ [Clostridiales bacterium]|nr:bifunctional glutamate N-acetyltransferase/amino-acid acetyltransferase ArgJ [Clostridiales bacterium]
MIEFKEVAGGICAPKGFTACGIHAGLRKNNRKDLALIYSETPCTAAAVYTQNKVKASPLIITASHIEKGGAKAIICNSGNANACNGTGMETAESMSRLTAETLGIDKEDVLVASTGIIGKELDIAPISKNIKNLVAALSPKGSSDCANAIMTTDLQPKEIAVTLEVGGVACSIGGICKGSGMIEPNMATMLGFIATDVKISSEMLKKALKEVVDKTFNMISVDGDTSTNDMTIILANGLAKNTEINNEGKDFQVFMLALEKVCKFLAKSIAKDGEGATKLLECSVSGTKDKKTAAVLAKSVINSNLFKAAMFGEDANWGRVLCALGYAGVDVDVNGIDISFRSSGGCIQVCNKGKGMVFDENLAKIILQEKEIIIAINVGDGPGSATAWGCDLSYDYVKINGDYRS